MGSIFGYKTEVVMRIAIAELLAFAYNLEYLLRLTKLKYTHIFIVGFHGSRIYQMKEKNIIYGMLKPKSFPYITYSVKGKEHHRTLTRPLCYEVLET